MKIEIKNYRGVADADLTIAPIALVAGKNHSGKSSIAQAVAAAITKNAAPIAGITKSAAGQLLRDGTKRGYCSISDDTGAAKVNWPGASVTEDGRAPYSSEIACGLATLVDMKPKEAASLLINVIEAMPTLDDLTGSLPNTDPSMLQQVWAAIQSEGWDAAHKRSQERGAKLKGAWEHVTGEKYGSAKAEGWTPAGFDIVAPHDMQAELTEARSQLESALANQAVDQSEVARLNAIIIAGEQAAAAISKERLVVNELTEDLDKLRAEITSAPQPEAAQVLAECPHCKGHLVVVSKTEVRAPESGISADENQRRQAAISANQAQYRQTEGLFFDAKAKLARAEQAVQSAEHARHSLASIPQGGATADAIQQLRENLNSIEADINTAKSVESAAKIHRDVAANVLVIEALAPDGIRKRVLADKMGAFNAALAGLSATAGWPQVTIQDDLSVTLGGRPYILLSESEKFRARVTLQVAMADLDGSELVIIDAADILDRDGRNGLIKLIGKCGLLGLICMTINTQADVPDISKAGLGRSYWLNENVLVPVGA